MKSQNLIL